MEVRDQWASDQGEPGARGRLLPPPPGGGSADAQAETALWGRGISQLPGLIAYVNTLRFPATKEGVIEQVGDRSVYIVPDFWVPVAEVLRRVPVERFESAADLKEAVAANWPSISPYAWLSSYSGGGVSRRWP